MIISPFTLLYLFHTGLFFTSCSSISPGSISCSWVLLTKVQNVRQFLLPFIIAAPSLSNPFNSFSHYSTIVFFLQNHSSRSVSLTFAQGAVLITWIAGITLSLDTQLNCVSPDKLLSHCCIALKHSCVEKTRRWNKNLFANFHLDNKFWLGLSLSVVCVGPQR